MSGMMESLSTLNSFVRTILAVVVVGAISVASWFGYTTYNAGEIAVREKEQALAAAEKRLQDAESRLSVQSKELVEKDEMLEAKQAVITTLGEEVRHQGQQIEQLETALRLLKVSHRVARLTVVNQENDPDTGKLFSLVEFVELDEEGKPLEEPRRFRIEGDVVYIDHWVVKFEDKYVEQADLDRSVSLVLFRRIFGEYQEPKDGYPLDVAGALPKAYERGGLPSEFEIKIWNDFWDIANDSDKAKQLGIRAAHGDALSIKVKNGKSYKVQLRASDGLAITPDDDAPRAGTRPAA